MCSPSNALLITTPLRAGAALRHVCTALIQETLQLQALRYYHRLSRWAIIGLFV
jgi:Ni,Fe-hydrogenase I cytochrome b subunit